MTIYRNILAVIGVGEDSSQVAQRARDLAAETSDVQLTLLHVVEYVPVEPLSDSLLPSVQIETELVDRARVRMKDLALLLGPAVRWQVASGNVKTEITRFAREGRFDLIVIGSHERHGLSILVNLTEDTVLHAAPCDVLAVRLPQGNRAT